jgi:uncharacterized protein (DUF2249 family)
MSTKVITLDVREDIRSGREPFGRIMTAANTLLANEQLQLLAPFEPVPLFHVLAKQGFSHTAHSLDSGDWEVLFTRQSEATAIPTMERPACQNRIGPNPTKTLEVDARSLEPPQPMVKILEAVSSLPEGAILHARTDRRPMHLYPQLEERGFTAETKEELDGSFLTQISRR